MPGEILSCIPLAWEQAELLKKLHLKPDSEQGKEFLELAEKARKVASPKALYIVGYVEEKTEETVRVNQITFTSRILRVNLEKVERVFPYICTCGVEIDRAGLAGKDMLRIWWVEVIKEMALTAARKFLIQHLQKTYGLDKLSSMNPGASDASVWPIQQQKLLFSLFGDVKSLIGVELTDSCLMLPSKTVSGFFFPARTNYLACRLCQRVNCPGRVAPYEEDFARIYHSPEK